CKPWALATSADAELAVPTLQTFNVKSLDDLVLIGNGDSEAGVGLYKSTNGGSSWSLVAGSTANTAPCASNPASFTCPVATGRSIGAVAVDPANPSHIFIGTDVARHGSSSVNGGRFTPPGSALVGLYESSDGGNSFAPAKI